MITKGLWEETDTDKPLAIAFSILLTPVTLVCDLFPVMLIANILCFIFWIFDKLND